MDGEDDDNYQRMPQTKEEKQIAKQYEGKARPTRNLKKEGCLMRCGKKTFNRLYPAQQKKAWTTQGKWLRSCIQAGFTIHLIFFVGSLLFIGFMTMLISLMLAAWSYSCYLTMNQCSIIFYMFLLIMATIYGLFYSITGDKQSY